MTVRHFDGSSGTHIDVSAGNASSVGFGPITVAVLWRPMAAAGMGLVRMFNDETAKVTVNPFSDGAVWFTVGSFAAGPVGYSATDGWRLDVFTKDSSVAALRQHVYLYEEENPEWTHINGETLSDVSGPHTHIKFGAFSGDQVLNGRLAAVGLWDTVLSDNDIEELTFDLNKWLDSNPIGLWVFNQDTTVEPVLDLTDGGADQTSISGTSIVTDDDPPGVTLDTDEEEPDPDPDPEPEPDSDPPPPGIDPVAIDFDFTELLNAVLSDVAKTGHFDSVNGNEPDNPPESGLTAGVWFQRIRPVGALSGLNISSGLVVAKVRFYTGALQKPSDAIDPRIMEAVSSVLGAWHDNYDFGGLIRNVDVFGQAGVPLSAEAGYQDFQRKRYRVMDITLPMIINDLWPQGRQG